MGLVDADEQTPNTPEFRLTTGQLRRLRDALQSAFPNYEALKELTLFYLGVPFDQISAQDALPTMIGALIQWAITRNRMRDLLVAANEANPGNSQLRVLLTEKDLTPAGAPPKIDGNRTITLAPIFSLPYERNPLFTGRDTELQRIDQLFTERSAVAIAGSGGMGKTQLAVEWIYRHQADYPGGVWWLPLQSEQSARDQAAAFAGPGGLNLPNYEDLKAEERIAAVQAHWADPQAKLLVFDNLDTDDPGPLLKQWRPRRGGAHVLITTRQEYWNAAQIGFLPLPPLQRADSMRLLLEPLARRFGQQPEDLLADQEKAQAADGICDEMGDLPLALALAGAYLAANPGVNPVLYLKLLKEAPLQSLALAEPFWDELPTGHAKSIVATFDFSYDRLNADDATDALALKLLHTAAQCAAAPIPPHLLLRGAGLDPTAEAEMEAAPALKRLGDLGLLATLPDRSFSLHRLLAAYIRSRDSAAAATVLAIAHALQNEFQSIYDAGDWLVGKPYAPHLRHAIATSGESTVTVALLNRLGELLYCQADYNAARPVDERALSISEQTLDPNHPENAYSLNNMAMLLQAQGQYAAARPLLERALSIRDQALGPNHPHTATSLNNLAGLLQAQGEYAASRPLFERALAIEEQIVGPNHPHVATSLNNLAGVLQAQGEYAAARPLLERALAIYEQTLGPDHPHTATSLNNVASLLKNQGDYAAARPLVERALSIREQTLGPNHPDTANSLSNLAALLQDQGDYATARPLLERALAIYEQALGPKHPDTRGTRKNLEILNHNAKVGRRRRQVGTVAASRLQAKHN